MISNKLKKDFCKTNNNTICKIRGSILQSSREIKKDKKEIFNNSLNNFKKKISKLKSKKKKHLKI